MTPTADEKKLCWIQKVALVRYNLHAATRTRDFTFFKTVQAKAFIDGVDHVAALQISLGDEADAVLRTLDDLNAGMAYVHQDGFKAVYDTTRESLAEDRATRLAKVCVDAHQQTQKAGFAIDKMANSAIELVQQQPLHSQDSVAAVWAIGATIVADAIKVCLDQMDGMDECLDDFVRLEYGWHTVQAAVEASVSAIRGIFSLMSPAEGETFNHRRNSSQRSMSVSSAASSTSSVIKRLSSVLFQSPVQGVGQANGQHATNTSPSRHGSFSSPSDIRACVSSAIPSHMPNLPPLSKGGRPEGRLSPIPPTPFGFPGEEVNPFELALAGDRSLREMLQIEGDHYGPTAGLAGEVVSPSPRVIVV